MKWFEHSDATLERLENELAEEAKASVEAFWEQIRERKRNKLNEGRLGCRVIQREGKSLQLVWYRKKWVGPKNNRILFSKPIPKGRNRNTYPSVRFKGFEDWEQELAEMFEEDFAAIREAVRGVAELKRWLKKTKGALTKLDMIGADAE